jgi:transposase-like protein
LARVKVQGWIQDLLEEELAEVLGRRKSERRAAVDAPAGYRNGHGKTRCLSMMAGTIALRRPRVRGLEERFESRLLPLFVRRTKEVSELLPQLYLHGLAQGDFELALRGLLGEGAPLSASSIERLRAKWQLEYELWKSQRLDELDVVYAWADGLYVKAGLEDSKAALLVIVGALRDGRKVVLAIDSGERESKESWARVLRDLRERGLRPWKVTRGRRASGNLVCLRRDLLGRRGAAVLEPSHHQRDRPHAEEGVARGEGAAAEDALRGDPRRV